MIRVLPPEEDELLSSFLLRQAGANFADHFRFYSYHAPGVAVWNRDFDRRPGAGLVKCLVSKFGLDETAIRKMTLPRFNDGTVERRRKPSTAPLAWVNAVGVFHRVRRLHGFQVCLQCLREAKVFKRLWRLSPITACPIHSVSLIDACHACDAPIIPHRQLSARDRCHQCYSYLDHGDQHSEDLSGVTAAQVAIHDAIYERRGIRSLSGIIPLGDLICGVNLLRRYKLFCTPLDLPGRPIEHQRVMCRRRYFNEVFNLASAWPSSIDQLDLKRKLTRDRFDELDAPQWLLCMKEHLSSGPRRVRSTTPGKNALSTRLQSLRTDKPTGWRGKHATLLVRSALRT